MCIVCMCAQLWPILCNPMNCSQPDLSAHGVFQAGILEWVAIFYSRDILDLGIEPTSLSSPALAGRFFTTVQPHLARLFILFSIQCAFGYSLDISGALEGMEVRNGILHRHV